MSSHLKQKQIIKKETINSGSSTNNSNIITKRNQCLYKKEILSSLIRLPTKIKQDGVLKSYNMENIQKERKRFNSRPITVNLNKNINNQSPSKSTIMLLNQKKNKIENLIKSLNDLFNQIQVSFMKRNNCTNECNDWIEIFNSNSDFIIEMCDANEYLPLINNCLTLLIFTIVIIYDISIQNKFQFFMDDIKSILNIFILLNESIFDKCKNSNKVNSNQQSSLISITNKDLNNNLNKIIENYYNINPTISKEIITLFHKLRRLNVLDIYDFYKSTIYNKYQYQSNSNINLNYDYPQNYSNQVLTHQDHIENLKRRIYKYNNMNQNNQNLNDVNNNLNTYNYRIAPYSSNTSNSMPIPKTKNMIRSPGNVLTTDINYIGAALTNSGVVFPFRKTNAMRQREKSQRIRSISSNINNNNYGYFNNYYPKNEMNNYENNIPNNYYSNVQFIPNNYSHNTSPIYHPNIYIQDFENNVNNESNFIQNQYYNDYDINQRLREDTGKYSHYDNNSIRYIENNQNLLYDNRNIGSLKLTLAKPNKRLIQRNIININTPLIPFAPDKPYTLVLDLDDTISHVPQGTNIIYLRPGLREFLESLNPYYELIVFTSGIKEYADQIINFIEIDQKYFDYRLYRQNASYLNEKNYKDIKRLGRDLKRTIVIDDKEDNIDISNGIIIKPFIVNNDYNNLNDYVLFELINILIQIAQEEPDDIRVSLRNYRNEINKIISK